MKFNNTVLPLILLLGQSSMVFAQNSEKAAEESFQMTMQTILSKFVDKKLSKEQLFHAATAGMLNSLNQNGEDWNKLLTPDEVKEMEIDLSGKVVGIGVAMEYNDENGTAKVLQVIPESAAEKAGIKGDDLILTVNNQSFKGRPFRDLVDAIRGEEGKSVQIKVLRDADVLKFNVKRKVVAWTPVQYEVLDGNTAILHIGMFNGETPGLVKKSLLDFKNQKLNKLIVDLRDNPGGAFQQMIDVAGYFVPNNSVIVSSKDREGKRDNYLAKDTIIDPKTKMIVLIDKETSSGAEILANALHEYNKAKIIGEKSKGKWNAQMVEKLPDQYAMKFTVKTFETAQGQTYQGIGLSPEIEIISPKTDHIENARAKKQWPLAKRLSLDTQLKAGLEYIQTM